MTVRVVAGHADPSRDEARRLAARLVRPLATLYM
jgi:hypothetical protein